MALTVVVGPPCAGKSTWVLTHAKPRDIVIDFDRLAVALAGPGADTHDHPVELWGITRRARRAALDAALRHRDRLDVYLIHSMPSQARVDELAAAGARFVVLDPGKATVLERVRIQRPGRHVAFARRWYDGDRPVLPGETRPEPTPTAARTSRSW